MELLIQAGADVKVVDKNGWTALMFAAGRGHNKCMELLIQAGADVKVVDKNGWTALMFDSWERTSTSA